jgi:hypothetical protein
MHNSIIRQEKINTFSPSWATMNFLFEVLLLKEKVTTLCQKLVPSFATAENFQCWNISADKTVQNLVTDHSTIFLTNIVEETILAK